MYFTQREVFNVYFERLAHEVRKIDHFPFLLHFYHLGCYEVVGRSYF